MPSFKPKTKKKIKINKKSLVTLDNKHNELLERFERNEKEVLPKLNKQKREVELSLKNDSLTLEEQLDLKDNLSSLKKEIINIKREKKEYLLDNSKYIFNYFEKKKEISDGNTKKTVLNSFFNKTKLDKDNEMLNDVQKYLINIDNSFININHYITTHDVCECQGELIPIEYEGIMVCNKCGKQQTYLIEHEKPSYKEPPKEVCFYAYKRINHFREILAQCQAKETTQIPDEVIENIKLQIKKERITIDELTNNKSKDILKKLGYNKYYEHVPFILEKFGIKPPVMSPELEDKLCNLFMEIEKHYAKHCPNDRVNFLNYYYVLFKMCEILGETRFLPYFPMLKDPVKRIEQDVIWKKICRELNWKFIPTI
uniref:Uncharacterized protein n=1 Tax=viral metagenome TaxID=1070528 RepID=A0A6C0KIF3_9ZZZZ